MDQEESLGWLDLLVDLENLECLEKQEDKDLLELLVCPDRRDLTDPEVLLETEDPLDRLECLVLRDRKEPLDLMVRLVQLVHQVLTVLQEIEGSLDCPDQLVLLGREGLLDHREREVMLVQLARRDPLVHLVLRVHPAHWVLEVSEEKRDLLVKLVLPAWEEDPGTKDPLAPLDP